MEKVLGLGGIFFRARDPKALAQWYETTLGVSAVPPDYDGEGWWQESGPTAFAPFAEDTGYFGRPEQAFMINFRVRDLAAMILQLQASGVVVTQDPEDYPNGRFARLQDPEGNPIELWEPKGKWAGRPAE